MAAQADKLTEGTKELLKRYPTMRVDVYPTHRTVAVPQRVLDNTAKNATGAKTVDGGVALENVLAGYPFPIPKTGSEAIWNHLLRYNGLGYDNPRYENWNVDAAGVPTLAVTADANWAWPIYDPKKTGPINASDPYWLSKLQYVGPARRNGEALLLDRRRQPAEAAAQGVAVPARPAPRQARAGPRVRHAESRRRRRRHVRRRVGVQRRDRPLRLEARRQEGDVRSVQQLSADVPQDVGGPHEAQSPQPGLRALGAASRVGGRGDAQGRQAPHLQQARVLSSTRTAGRRSRPTSTTRAASSTARASRIQSYSYDAQAPFGDTFAIYDFSSGVYNITGLFGPYNGLKYMTELPKDSFWSSEALAGAGLR